VQQSPRATAGRCGHCPTAARSCGTVDGVVSFVDIGLDVRRARIVARHSKGARCGVRSQTEASPRSTCTPIFGLERKKPASKSYGFDESVRPSVFSSLHEGRPVRIEALVAASSCSLDMPIRDRPSAVIARSTWLQLVVTLRAAMGFETQRPVTVDRLRGCLERPTGLDAYAGCKCRNQDVGERHRFHCSRSRSGSAPAVGFPV
jgi:hypothetical protein